MPSEPEEDPPSTGSGAYRRISHDALIRVLYIENDRAEYERAHTYLTDVGFRCDMLLVEHREAFIVALKNGHFDVILADYALQRYDGRTALAYVIEQYPHIPFIMVSDALDEELVVESLRQGATDCVAKHRLSRLPAVLSHALSEDRRRAQAMGERYAAIFELADAGIALTNREGMIVDANPFLCRYLGYSAQELIRLRFDEITHQEDRAASQAALAQTVASAKSASLAIRHVRKDGAVVFSHLVLSWLSGAGTGSGNTMAILFDRTAQVQLESQLRAAQRLEAVGQLAGGIAHDFNNVVTAIAGFAELLVSDLPQGKSHQDAVEITEAAARAARLTSQLLAFSRGQKLDPQAVDISRIVSEMQGMLRQVLSEDIDLVIACKERCPALADVGQLEQVILNLVVNARDAMPNGGTLRIRTERVKLDASDVALRHPMAVGRYVRLAVADTGTGMTAKVRDKAFEPFFTTKDVDKGTGLGLSTSYGIIKQLGGYIWIQSKVGRGSTIEIFLPQISQATPHELRRPVIESRKGGSEAILVVEDEPQVRRLTQRLLERSGYAVRVVASGSRALELARGDLPIDLLLTDVVMPHMSGPDLAEKLQALRPGLRVLFMSGYSRRAKRKGATTVINKPFSTAELLAGVRAALDRS